MVNTRTKHMFLKLAVLISFTMIIVSACGQAMSPGIPTTVPLNTNTPFPTRAFINSPLNTPAAFDNLNFNVYNVRVVPESIAKPQWVDYVFLLVELTIQNNGQKVFIPPPVLVDDQNNQYAYIGAYIYFKDYAELPLIIDENKTVSAPALYGVPKPALAANLRIRWNFDNPPVFVEIFIGDIAQP